MTTHNKNDWDVPMPTHVGSRDDRLSKIVTAIYEHHQGEDKYDYNPLLRDLKELLKEYGVANVDDLIKRIKYNDKLSLDEIAHIVIDQIMKQANEVTKDAEEKPPTPRTSQPYRNHFERQEDGIMAAVKTLGINPLAPIRGDRLKVINKAIHDGDPSITMTESTAPKAYQRCIKKGRLNKIM